MDATLLDYCKKLKCIKYLPDGIGYKGRGTRVVEVDRASVFKLRKIVAPTPFYLCHVFQELFGASFLS